LSTINIVKNLIRKNHRRKAIANPRSDILSESGDAEEEENVARDNTDETDERNEIRGDPKREQVNTPVPKCTEEQFHEQRPVLAMILVQGQVLNALLAHIRHVGERNRITLKLTIIIEKKNN
jgi:hypothetical protein